MKRIVHPSRGRRALLRALGGAALTLPFLEYFAPRQAQAAPGPKRILFLTTPNGTNPATHWPTGTTSNFQLSSILSAFEPYKDNLVVVRGVDNLAAEATNQNGHTDAVRCMLTGRVASNTNSDDYTAASGPSVDQHIASFVGRQTAFKSLEYNTSYTYAHPTNYCSFYGENQPAPFEDEPIKLFDRVFGDYAAIDDTAAIARREDRQSVLHASYESYAALDKRLGATDRQRLALHLDTLKDLEQQIVNSAGVVCTVPGAPTEDDGGDVGVDVLLRAMACDLTRVATIRTCYWDSYDFLGATGSYHDDWLHHVTSDPAAATMVDNVKSWQCQQMAAIIEKLIATPDGDGTLFDSTLVVWVDEFCHGYAHDHHEVPYVMLCGTDRFFEMGRYLHYANGVSTNRLLNSLIAAMDVPGAGDFGDPQFDNTPLSELS